MRIVDADMVFDEKTKRYMLSNDYVANDLGTDLSIALMDEFDTNLSTINDRALKLSSDLLYDYLRAKSIDYKSTRYKLATDADWNEVLKDALKWQLLHFMLKGDLDTAENAKVEDSISKRAISVLKDIGAFFIKTEDLIEEY